MYKIIIDAGHGQYKGSGDPGAVYGNRKESDYTLVQALTIKKMLEFTGDIEVVLTRSDENYVLLSDRRKVTIENPDAKIFLSLHMNANENTSLSGNSVYFSDNKVFYKKNKIIAELISEKLDNIGYISNPIDVDFANYLPNDVDMCYVSVRPCFITNDSDMVKYNCNEICRAISNAILKYVGIPEINSKTIFSTSIIPGQCANQVYIGEIEIIDEPVPLREAPSIDDMYLISKNIAKKGQFEKVMEKFIISKTQMYRLRSGFYIQADIKNIKYSDIHTVPETEDIIGEIVIKFNGLAIHNKPMWTDDSIAYTAKAGETYDVFKRVNISNGYMYELRSGLYVTDSETYVSFKKI